MFVHWARTVQIHIMAGVQNGSAADTAPQEDCEFECPLCLQTQRRDKACRTVCNHTFCAACFMRALEFQVAALRAQIIRPIVPLIACLFSFASPLPRTAAAHCAGKRSPFTPRSPSPTMSSCDDLKSAPSSGALMFRGRQVRARTYLCVKKRILNTKH
jgi:hypothetical protein